MFGIMLTDEEIKEIIEVFKKSNQESMEVPKMKGMFITQDCKKGESVIYIDQIEVDGETYYFYTMNPLA